jgi:hypothetical protein
LQIRYSVVNDAAWRLARHPVAFDPAGVDLTVVLGVDDKALWLPSTRCSTTQCHYDKQQCRRARAVPAPASGTGGIVRTAFVTSQGHTHARFPRALLTNEPEADRAVSRELQHVGLDDALRVLVVFAERRPSSSATSERPSNASRPPCADATTRTSPSIVSTALVVSAHRSITRLRRWA